VRARAWRPTLLAILLLALPAGNAATTSAASRPREQAALLELFATDAALARAQQGAQTAHERLVAVRGDLASMRLRLGVARENERAAQHALSSRLNEIYRAHPLDMLGVLLAARSFTQISDGFDLLDRLSRQDSALVRSARRWHAALQDGSRRLRAAETRARTVQRAWEDRVAELAAADQAQRSVLARLQRRHVGALTRIAATAHRAARRARTIIRPQAHGGSAASPAAPTSPATTTPAATAPGGSSAPATTAQPAPPLEASLAPGTTLSVAASAYSLPGHTASGLPVGPGICATDPRVIPLGTRFDVPGYGTCVAADTGSTVIGAMIDIWMPGGRASVYGRQTITITFR
jgi:3D (Asp-Asp-Asp) domain-containing protein